MNSVIAAVLELNDFPAPQRVLKLGDTSTHDAVTVRVLGRRDMNHSFGDFVPQALLVDFVPTENSEDYVDVADENAATNFCYAISIFLTAAFGFFIPAGSLIMSEGRTTFRRQDDHVQLPARRGVIGGTLLGGSCLKFSVESCAQISHHLLKNKSWDDGRLYFLERAAMFYAESQIASGHSVNVAYALLISALECLSSSRGIESSELLDDEDSRLLDSLAQHDDFGNKIASRVKSRFYQLKRKCVAAALQCFDDTCYQHEISGPPKSGACRVKPSDWPKRISASYDLRSSFVHSGADHASVAMSWWKSDRQNIRSMANNPNSQKLLKDALNIYQLNSIVQHCLSFAIRERINPHT